MRISLGSLTRSMPNMAVCLTCVSFCFVCRFARPIYELPVVSTLKILFFPVALSKAKHNRSSLSEIFIGDNDFAMSAKCQMSAKILVTYSCCSGSSFWPFFSASAMCFGNSSYNITPLFRSLRKFCIFPSVVNHCFRTVLSTVCTSSSLCRLGAWNHRLRSSNYIFCDCWNHASSL